MDTVLTVIGNMGITVPIFWLGIILIYVVGLYLDLLPIQGWTSPFEDFWLSTKQIIMPISLMRGLIRGCDWRNIPPRRLNINSSFLSEIDTPGHARGPKTLQLQQDLSNITAYARIQDPAAVFANPNHMY